MWQSAGEARAAVHERAAGEERAAVHERAAGEERAAVHERAAGEEGSGEARRRERGRYSPLYAWRPLNQSEPEYVTRTIPNPTTSSSAARRPAHERWFRAWR